MIWLSLCCLFGLSSSEIVTEVGDYLYESPVIDLTKDGSDITMYVRLCKWKVLDGSNVIVDMTRYCYCTSSNDDDSCSFPGPTLKMQDNTDIDIKIVNQLQGSDIVYGPGTDPFNTLFKDMDTTNIHSHGLHVSPQVDNVLLAIKPGEDHTYSYKIGYHYPGTYWYHAHHHGSTTWQVTQGLHGTILMQQDEEDEDTDGADGIAKYEENVLMFSAMYIIPENVCNACPAWGAGFSDFALCEVYCTFPETQTGDSGYVYDVSTDISDCDYSVAHLTDPKSDCFENSLLFFTNGQLSPVIKLTKDYYRRLRLTNSLAHWVIQFKFPEQCEWYLIATDGVYIGSDNEEYMNYDLSNSPHDNELLISPGGRADVLVKCDTDGVYNVLSSESNTQDDTIQYFQRIPDGRVLFSIEVEDSDSDSDESYEDDTDALPDQDDYPEKREGSYIENVWSADSSGSTSTDGEDTINQCECNWNTDGQSEQCLIYFSSVPPENVNGKTLFYTPGSLSEDSLTFVEYDKSYEFIINNNNDYNDGKGKTTAHVYHQHTNPFFVENGVGNNFIALPGTWFDTLGNMPTTPDEYINIKFWTRDFKGIIIVHCHILQHEDQGMMGYYEIVDNVDSDDCPNSAGSSSADNAKSSDTKSHSSHNMVDSNQSSSFNVGLVIAIAVCVGVIAAMICYYKRNHIKQDQYTGIEMDNMENDGGEGINDTDILNKSSH